MLTALGALYVQGAAIDWASVHKGAARRKITLPLYPFARQRYWIEPAKAHYGLQALGPLIDKMIQAPTLKQTLFETAINPLRLPFLRDHRIYETIVAPGACHLAMVLSAAALAQPPQVDALAYQLNDVIFPEALTLTDGATRTAQIILTPADPDEVRRDTAGDPVGFQLVSFASGASAASMSPAIHATGSLMAVDPVPAATTGLQELQARYSEALAVTFYPDETDSAVPSPLVFGPTFRWLDGVWRQPDQPAQILGRLHRPAAVEHVADYLLHPGLLDACFQLTTFANQVDPAQAALYLPFALDQLTLYPPTVGSDEEFWWCQVVQVDALKWDIRLFTSDGQLLAALAGFMVRAAPQAALQAAQIRTDWLYTLAWTPKPLVAAPPTSNKGIDGWLIWGDGAGLGHQLVAQLQADARPIFWATPQNSHDLISGVHHLAVDPTDGAAVHAAIAQLTAQHGRLGVVYLGDRADLIPASVPTATVSLCGGLLHLAQALAATTASVQLWVVTQDCQVVDQDAQLNQLSASRGFAAAAGALWGLARTLAKEEPSLHVVCVDVAAGDHHVARLLHAEVVAGLAATAGTASLAGASQFGGLDLTGFANLSGLPPKIWDAPAQAEPLDTQIAYHQGLRYVAQLRPWQAPKPLAAAQPVRLQLSDYGSLENLAFVPMTRRQPAAGEVEVAVKAVGLNFRDVLITLGMMKDYYAAALGVTSAKAVGLGFECAGQITAVGAGVTGLAVGDRVMGLAGAEGAFASYITVPADQLVPIPDQISDAAAATIPLTFLTAWYGLVELAKLQPGERVLIHAAAGGVGQAALQIAHALGAEVIATASPAKWDFLRGQGVAHVLNSRTLTFAEEIAQITGGRGVDVVLNSLNGDFIARSFAALRQGGRFVEIGKIGIWSQAQVAQGRPDVAYFPFDLGEALYTDPTLHTTLWQAIRKGLTDGTLRPLPQTTFPAQEIVAAFRYMQQAKQIGKVVVTFAEPHPLTIHADGTYLLTGGLGALGLQIAQQLVEDGARNLVLTGRQGITSDAQRAVLDQLAEAGANVQVIAADIGNLAEVKSLLDRCGEIAPLRGIVHAAGLLDDGVLASQTVERLAKVMRPKVDGAWHLHTLTQELPLDFFVCFSSAAALTGSPGQSNYAAANAFLDSLMQQRRQQGLPGLSINWGAWAQGGMAAHLQQQLPAAALESYLISPAQGRLLFRYLLGQTVSQVGVLPLQRQQAAAQATVRRQAQRSTLRETLAKVARDERQSRLETYVRSEIMSVLGLTANTWIDARTRLFDFGLDSLMAVELRNKLERLLDCSLRSTLIFDYPTLEVLVPYLYHEILGDLAEATSVAPAAAVTSSTLVTAALNEPIAIVGMGCRFPGPVGLPVDSPQRFWASLVAGFDGIIDLPDQRVIDLYGQPNGAPADGATAAIAAYALRGGFLTQIDQFDPAFFGLAPREVLVMDPAHRLLLETAWQALEAANIVPATLFNTEVGVFIGNGVSGYASLCSEVENNLYIATGNTASTASGRLSYLLGLTGPAVSIDTACSSSLTAIHLACQSLRSGECNAALAGGVNVILDAGSTAMFASGNMLSSAAQCKTFDAAADGYVRGEGCGIVVLKRLADAQANDDTILAVIRGSAVNQDGPSGGLTVPNGPAQARVIRRALANANLGPEQIGYIEAHGTGTPLGDPIEIGALTAVFAGRVEPLYVGSVKTNVGHLEMAAGVAGLMKLVLSLQHGQIPPHLHLHTPNPHIDWANAPVQVPTALTAWPQGSAGERIGGVSSFGFSGTNAHVIVSAAPTRGVTHESTRCVSTLAPTVYCPLPTADSSIQPVRSHHLLTIAAKSEQSLHAYVQRYQDLLAAQPDLALGDLCYTSHVGRSHFAQRLALTASSVPALQAQLATYLNGQSNAGISQGTVDPRQATPKACPGRVAFLFTGQGAQYVNMGRELYTTSPTFRAILDECDGLLQAALGESLLAVMYPETVDSGQWTVDSRHETRDTRHASRNTHHASRTTLDDTTYTQPALFVLEYALARLWQSWGVQPEILIGHSVGEVAAACVAGVFSLADGLKLIAARGRLMGALPQDGAMISLLAAETRVQEVLAPYENEVSIAAVNGPESVVISGKREAVLAITEQLAAVGVKNRPLTVSHAFHSPLMEPMLADFRQVAESITYHEPKLHLVSNVTGQLAGAEISTAAYWVRHVRAAVRFADGVQTLHDQGIDLFLEIGPKPVLLGLAGQAIDQMISDPNAASTPHPLTPSPPHPLLLPSLRDGQSDWQQLLSTLGEFYVRGVGVDWAGFDHDYQPQKIMLPTYPFQRQSYWPAAKAHAVVHTTSWFATADIAQLTDRVLARMTDATNGADPRAIVTQVLTALDDEQRAEQMTAQVDALLYEVAWTRQSNPLPLLPPATPGRWLILADDQEGIGAALATGLQGLGEAVEVLTVAADVVELISARFAAADGIGLRGVVHCCGLKPESIMSGAALMAYQEETLGTLLTMVQTLATIGGRGVAPRLWVITQGAQQITPDELVAVAQTPLWGLGRVIALEHGEVWGGLIDLDEVTPAQLLLAEILPARPDGETQVAYRQGVRHVARLVRSKQPQRGQPAVAIHADATYLITGGLGALGLLVARWLAEQGARQLILTGRRGITTDAQRDAFNQLAAAGVTVQLATVDVADETAMRELFAQIAAGAFALKGIFHTAGVLDDALLRNQRWDRFAPVLASKVTGGWLLHQLTQGLALDFMVFFSSAAALLGNLGQANYGAANAFLDGLAGYRQQQGLPALSINWGAWAEVGMAARTVQGALTDNQLITPQVGLATLSRLLPRSGQIGVLAMDWTQLQGVSRAYQPFFANFVTPPAMSTKPAALVAELANLPVNQRLAQLRAYVQQALGTVLGMTTPPDRTTGFAELGLDSLMALELRRRLEGDLHVTLPTTVAFEYPTVDTLTAYLLNEVLALASPTAAPAEPRVPSEVGRAFDEPIAVISMACRFPGADTPEAFWALLAAGADLVGEVPRSRWDIDALYDPQRPQPGKMYTRSAAFIDGVEAFDPLFFGIAPREAVSMDPQHRLLLEVSWEALERAGLAPSTLVDSQTGVFVGIGASEYGVMSDLQAYAGLESHAATSSGHSIAAGRLAYTLGLQGPTLAVDTACSSSLVALHLACQSLRAGECDLALAGGVNLMLSPFTPIALSQMQALSPDGRCKTFDAAADGYGRGEGGGMVLLKRLADAEIDGDTILAVIKGSAVNHDGHSSGLTVPNKRAQEKLLRQALAAAHVTPDAVSYIEAHGTGTPLGDPIELRALGAVFGNDRANPLLVGSVKTNVGHLEAAAGIVGFVKTVLALQHRQIPPHLHFHTPSPYIEWDEFAVAVPTTLQPWPHSAASTDGELIAGISAFGLSGTNAHLVVAAAPQAKETRRQGHERVLSTREDKMTPVGRPLYLLPLAAKSEGALGALAARYQAQLQTHPTLDLGDLCYTAAVGRNHFSQRLALVASTVADLQAKLGLVAQGQSDAAILQGTISQRTPKIAFLFTGQGSQFVGMGRTLYATNPTFRAILEQCDGLLQEELGESLLAVLYPETVDSGQWTVRASVLTPRVGRRHETRDTRHEIRDTNHGHASVLATRASRITIDDTTYTQPALFVLEYALATLWQSWGVQPDLLIGHSVGEVVAACVAGVFSLADGLKLIAARGRLMGALPQDGAMFAVLADEARVQAAIAAYRTDVSIAAVNGPENTVISGKREAVLAIAAQLAAAGIKSRQLTVSHAFHSPLMEPMLADFRQVAASITYHAPQYPLVSNVTGQLAGAEILTPDYWVDHVRAAVRFADGVATLHAQGIDLFLEIGPKPTLLGMVEPILEQVTRWQGHERVGYPLGATRGDKVTVSSPSSEGTSNLHPLTRSPGHLVMLPSLRQNQPDWQVLLESLGTLYVQGVAIDWRGFAAANDGDEPRHKVALPTYPFQRQRYWLDPSPAPAPRMTGGLRPLIDKMIAAPALRATLFETAMSVAGLPFLTDHRVYTMVVAPGACHLAMVLSAAELTFATGLTTGQGYGLKEVVFPQPLALGDEETRTVQIIFTPARAGGDGAQAAFQLLSFTGLPGGADFQQLTHATGSVGATGNGQPDAPLDLLSLSTLQARCTVLIPTATDQADGDDAPIFFGPAFRWIEEIWHAPPTQADARQPLVELLAKLRRPAAIPSLTGYLLHPALLDACFQVVGWGHQLSAQTTALHLPFALDRLQLYASVMGDVDEENWWCHVTQRDATKWDIRLFDNRGQLFVAIAGYEVRAAPQSAIQSSAVRADWLYTLDWEALSLPDNIENVQRPDCWVLWGDAGQLGRALIQQLGTTGTPIFVVQSHAMPHEFGEHPALDGLDLHYHVVDPTDAAAVGQLMNALAGQQGEIGVVYLGMGDEPIADAAVPATALALSSGLLHLAQALAALSTAAQLWIVTAGVQVLDHDADIGALGAPSFVTAATGALWGLGRTIAQEQPQLRTICIDLDDTVAPEAQAPLLATEIFGSVGAEAVETQIAYHQQTRYVARLDHWQGLATTQAVSTAQQPMRLQLQEYGSLENLRFVPLPRQAPGAHEVEVEVKAVGLNFRDVLNTLGMLRSYYADVLGIHRAADVALGFECAGVVTAVGADVTTWAVGDRVMGIVNGAFAGYVTVPATALAQIPAHFSFAEAATIPLAFLTAWYGLKEVANLQAGERILIHAVAGGVGQAALQIAQESGAVVWGTASPAKWAFLRKQGVDQILNSRTLDFAEQIVQQTGGTGVDVVLNSLSGDFVTQSFAALGQQGRFVEIGKLGIWTEDEAAQRRPDAAYHPFDLGEVLALEPALYPKLWAALQERFASGAFKPLPHKVFAAHAVVDAFRFMQQAKQIGKVVVSFEPPARTAVLAEASYLITGGLGDLGLQIAQQLAAEGAKQLVLAGRRAVVPESAQPILAQLAADGVTVQVVQADVAERADVERLLAACDQLAPLRGIIHAAGVLDDGLLTQQSVERFGQVMRPKVDGTWHLHSLSQRMPLDFFVCFSSAASLLGAAGQGNYAAANAFMDTLMQQRVAAGLPGLSINWGPWAEIGMAARLAAQHQKRLATGGIGAITPKQGAQFFAALLANAAKGGQVGVLPIRWEGATGTAATGFLERLVRPAQVPLPSQNQELPALLAQFESASAQECQRLFVVYLQEAVTRILRLPALPQPQQGLVDIGMDSLMAVELRSHVGNTFQISLSMTAFIDSSIEQLAVMLAEQFMLARLHQAGDQPTGGASAASPANQPAAQQETDQDDVVIEEFVL